MRLGIFGRGRLAQAIASAAAEGRGVEIAWLLGHDEEPEGEVDLALDASAAPALAGHLAWALETGTDLAIGSTGWDPALLDGARAQGAGLSIGILVAPNFSIGVAFMRRAALALGRLATLGPGADLAILERHHRAKRDSPSGTARLLATALAEGCPRYAKDPVPITSQRLGAEVGFHELRLETGHEAIVLSHSARDRGLFAQGALESLSWLQGRKGVYSFDDFAQELIEPLFAPPQTGPRPGRIP